MADDRKRQRQLHGRGISALNRTRQRGNTTHFQQLLKADRRPGFTTPAETAFAFGVLKSLTARFQKIDQLCAVLVKGNRSV